MICVHFLINKLNIEHIIALGGKKSNEKLGKNRKRGIELFTGRHFWNRKCRKKTWWQQEFAVFKCEATANSVTGHVCVNSNETLEEVVRFTMMELTQNKQIDIIEENTMEKC